jgi:hypothetical protein
MNEWVSMVGGTFACAALFLVPFLLVMGLMVFGIIRSGNVRGRDLAGLASELGFSFSPKADHEPERRFPNIFIFTLGTDRHVANTMQGGARLGGHDVEITMGDYRFKTSSAGDSSRKTKRTISYVVARLPWSGIPEVTLRNEHFLDRFAAVVGFEDIDFESESFSRRFHVKSKDRRFAYDLFDPRMIEFLLDTRPPSMEIQGDLICIYGSRELWNESRIKERLQWLGRFVQHWPEHLLEEAERKET